MTDSTEKKEPFWYLSVAIFAEAREKISELGFSKACEFYGMNGSELWNLLQNGKDKSFTIEQERAQVMLETYGSTSGTDEPFFGWFWCSRDGAPEWLTAEDLDGAEPDSCVTVLDYSLREPEAPAGWKRVYSYAAGEKDCPWCEGTGNAKHYDPEAPDVDGQPACCALCDGDGLLYEGEECRVVVFAPLQWIVGSGEPGCLYDSGPETYDSLEAAIEGAVMRFEDSVGPFTIERMRKFFTENEGGCYYFDRRIRPFAGASLVEISGPQ